MKPIAIFYHCLFVRSIEHKCLSCYEQLPSAIPIISEQMAQLRNSGLLEQASYFLVGINGSTESFKYADNWLPSKSFKVFHGLDSKAENLTIVELEKWLPAHDDWNVLYFHSKGATHPPNSDYSQLSGRWRRCMMRNLVDNWRQCVGDLDQVESVGCHWLTGMAQDKSQNLWGGNFWWARSSFLRTLPSIFLRGRIKQSGIAALESRYEAEVWIGNGPRLPSVRDYHPGGLGLCP